MNAIHAQTGLVTYYGCMPGAFNDLRHYDWQQFLRHFVTGYESSAFVSDSDWRTIKRREMRRQAKDTAVLCFNPAHSKTLVDFYYGFHEKFEDYCTGIGWYNSIRHGNPIMHYIIGVFDVAVIQKVMEIIFAEGVFGEAKIVALELYTYPMRLIKRFDLEDTP